MSVWWRWRRRKNETKEERSEEEKKNSTEVSIRARQCGWRRLRVIEASVEVVSCNSWLWNVRSGARVPLKRLCKVNSVWSLILYNYSSDTIMHFDLCYHIHLQLLVQFSNSSSSVLKCSVQPWENELWLAWVGEKKRQPAGIWNIFKLRLFFSRHS